MRLHTEGKLKRHRIYRNIACNISTRLIITTAVLRQLNPTHRAVEQLNTGYEDHTTKTKVSNTNVLKHIGKTEEKLQNQMQVVRNFSDDIRAEFGLHKCAKI